MLKMVNGELVEMTKKEIAEHQAVAKLADEIEAVENIRTQLRELDRRLPRFAEDMAETSGLKLSPFLEDIRTQKEALRGKLVK